MEHEIERLDKYLSMKGINDNEFTVNTGISQGWIGKARRDKFSITDKTRLKILKYYYDLNPVWLQTGFGEMLISIKKIEAKDLPENFDIKKDTPIQVLLELSETEKEFWKKKYIDLLGGNDKQ